MRIGEPVSWDHDVLPSWRRSANNAPRPNSDVWRPLPPSISWSEAEVEGADPSRLYLLGSADFLDAFGSYRVGDVGRAMTGDDRHGHHRRVRSLAEAIRSGRPFEPPVLVAETAAGPFVIIDGNHRCLAYHALGNLPGVRVYLGLAPGLLAAYPWARHARE